MAMYLKDYVEVLDNFRKNWLMKNLFLILSDNPRKPKNEQLIAILAEHNRPGYGKNQRWQSATRPK